MDKITLKLKIIRNTQKTNNVTLSCCHEILYNVHPNVHCMFAYYSKIIYIHFVSVCAFHMIMHDKIYVSKMDIQPFKMSIIIITTCMVYLYCNSHILLQIMKYTIIICSLLMI